MNHTPVTRCGAWIAILASISAVALLVFYLPVVAAILFVILTGFAAIVAGKKRGAWRGVTVFIREILFGW